jgi:1,2-dihydroxy-3-keto-5-methylthiopentene dioxygenase
MAILTLRDENKTLNDPAEVSAFLDQYGIWYRFFEGAATLSEDATNEDILAAFDEPIQQLMDEGDSVTADVIQLRPNTPNLDVMLDKFNKEHWHEENEVRFIVEGSGLFHIHPKDGPIFSIEMFKGDMINVPKGTLHWFDLCKERQIRAIRLFEDPAGWTPYYTDSKVDAGYQPMCFGPSYIPPQS